MDVFQAGFVYGANLATRVTDLTYHSEMMQLSLNRIPPDVPMSVEDRAVWLNGLASGIKSIVFPMIMAISAQNAVKETANEPA